MACRVLQAISNRADWQTACDYFKKRTPDLFAAAPEEIAQSKPDAISQATHGNAGGWPKRCKCWTRFTPGTNRQFLIAYKIQQQKKGARPGFTGDES